MKTLKSGWMVEWSYQQPRPSGGYRVELATVTGFSTRRFGDTDTDVGRLWRWTHKRADCMASRDTLAHANVCTDADTYANSSAIEDRSSRANTGTRPDG